MPSGRTATSGVMSIREPVFASEDNFFNITRNFAFIGIMALGMTPVIITGGIDLSVGSVMGVVAIVCGLTLLFTLLPKQPRVHWHIPTPRAFARS